MKEKLMKIWRIVKMVFGGSLIFGITIGLIFCLLFLIKHISAGMFFIADIIMHFITKNWKISLGVIACLLVGMIEWEIIVLPKIKKTIQCRKYNSKKNSDSSKSDENSFEYSAKADENESSNPDEKSQKTESDDNLDDALNEVLRIYGFEWRWWELVRHHLVPFSYFIRKIAYFYNNWKKYI